MRGDLLIMRDCARHINWNNGDHIPSLFLRCRSFPAHKPSQPRRGTLHECTAVDVDLLAGDVIAVRHKEEHRFGDFLGVSEATHWDLALDY